MVRGLLTLALLALTLGCGREQEAAELKKYMEAIQGLDSYSRRIQAEIQRFDDPTQEIIDADIEAALGLLTEYQSAVAAVAPPTTSTGGNTHELFVRCFDEAMFIWRPSSTYPMPWRCPRERHLQSSQTIVQSNTAPRYSSRRPVSPS